MPVAVVAVLALAAFVVFRQTKAQNVEKRAGFGPRCRYCQSRLKFNPAHTGWARVCRKCGRAQ